MGTTPREHIKLAVNERIERSTGVTGGRFQGGSSPLTYLPLLHYLSRDEIGLAVAFRSGSVSHLSPAADPNVILHLPRKL